METAINEMKNKYFKKRADCTVLTEFTDGKLEGMRAWERRRQSLFTLRMNDRITTLSSKY